MDIVAATTAPRGLFDRRSRRKDYVCLSSGAARMENK